MSLNDLTASQLAKIDQICLDFESEIRAGKKPSVEHWIAQDEGVDVDVLRRELLAIEAELADQPLNQPTDASRASTVNLPTTGTLIGPYRVGDVLGHGGMGVVFQAVDQRLNRKVAIKFLSVDRAKRDQLAERFEREARAVAALSHPNIVQLFDVGVREGLPYAVMEFLDGQSLDDRFESGRMPAAEVRRIGAQIADALAAAHSSGVIHRDLKPRNIMLVPQQGSGADPKSEQAAESIVNGASQTELVKLFDFGLSRVAIDDQDETDRTGEGIILGTPGYMAPEQIRGESVSAAADIFSLGCILHEAYYGNPAFDGATSSKRFKATLNDTPPADPLIRREDLPLSELIESCLQKEAFQRPKSAAKVASLLREETAGADPILASLQSGYAAGRLTRRRMLVVFGGVSIGAALAGVLLWYRQQPAVTIASVAVLSFQSAQNSALTNEGQGQPIGARTLDFGENLSALIAYELSNVPDLSVSAFRPIQASGPQSYRELGAQLEVDALLTGKVQSALENDESIQLIDIQLVSSKTGMQLWGQRFRIPQEQDTLELTRLAGQIALAIGHQLVPTAEQTNPPISGSFACLVDGRTRLDPDSVPGLQKALLCLNSAKQQDPNFAPPLGGIALASITLAAQSPMEESVRLIREARQASQQALSIDRTLVDARLAQAMLDWQTLLSYDEAGKAFRELDMVAKYNWQIQHQYGLLLMAHRRFTEATTHLDKAARLNPMCVLVELDRVRNAWYAGNRERASLQLDRIQDRNGPTIMTRGVRIDMYEQSQMFREAAELQEDFRFDGPITADSYFAAREQHLARQPYGPFGETMNRAIWQARNQPGLTESQLENIADQTPPMLPLLLAVHPAFQLVRSSSRAIEILPKANP